MYEGVNRPNEQSTQSLLERIGRPKLSPHPAGACTTPTNDPPLVPLTHHSFTTPTSGQTPVSELALHRLPPGASTNLARLPPQDVPSGQTLVQELPQTPLADQSAAVISSPAAVSAPVRLQLQLLARMFEYLPHHRRI